MRTSRLFVVPAALIVLAGCASNPPMNQGTSGYRMDPTHDSPAEYGSQSPRSQDLVTATDRMAMSIAQRLDIVNQQSRPIIYVGEIENKTSLPQKDFQVFLARLRAQLQQSGARHGLDFVRERAFIERERTREYGGKDPQSTAGAYTSRADYVLTCEVYDLPSGGTNYFMFDYQLVQLRDAVSGPDVGRGNIAWEGMYEVKFQ